jgi:hypothetical protein
VFERFQLPDVAAVARRTMVGALVVGVVGLVLALVFSQPWLALGLGIGLGLGMGNFRLIVRSVLKVGRRMTGSTRRPLALNTLSRLMLLTAVALVLLWVEPPLGLGIVAGLAVFQFILLANVTRSMLKAGGAGGGGGAGLLFGALMSGGADGGTPEDAGPGAGSGEAGAQDVGGQVDVAGEGWGAA